MTMVCAAITLESTSMDPTDRSMPAVMITNVTPTARSRSSEASTAMLRKLSPLRKAVPSRTEKAITSPASMRKMKAEPARLESAQRAHILDSSCRVSVCVSATLHPLFAAQRSGHGSYRIVGGGLPGIELRDQLSQAQNDYAVGDVEDLRQVVAD